MELKNRCRNSVAYPQVYKSTHEARQIADLADFD